MKRARLALALAVAGGLIFLPAVSRAGGMVSIVVRRGALHVAASGAAVAPVAAGALVLGSAASRRAFGPAVLDSAAYLIVDATPPEAQVFLDGRLLGSSGQLVARALPLSPGRHALTITARGFRPYVAQFDADPTFPIRVRVALALE